MASSSSVSALRRIILPLFVETHRLTLFRSVSSSVRGLRRRSPRSRLSARRSGLISSRALPAAAAATSGSPAFFFFSPTSKPRTSLPPAFSTTRYSSLAQQVRASSSGSVIEPQRGGGRTRGGLTECQWGAPSFNGGQRGSSGQADGQRFPKSSPDVCV